VLAANEMEDAQQRECVNHDRAEDRDQRNDQRQANCDIICPWRVHWVEIVLFEFVEERERLGDPLIQALLDAGIERLRPIVITVGAKR
jgi:hypothetical protein